MASAMQAALAAPGDLDSTFGTAGVARLPRAESAQSVRIGAEGRLFATSASAVVRFTADGRVDSAFGTGGVTSLVIEQRPVSASAIKDVFPATDGSARVLLTGTRICIFSPGTCAVNGHSNFDLMLTRRLSSVGQPAGAPGDAVPGQGVETVLGVPLNSIATGAGSTQYVTSLFNNMFSSRVSVQRLESDGAFTDIAQPSATAALVCGMSGLHVPLTALASTVQTDGRLVIAMRLAGEQVTPRLCVVRLTADGNADSSFGTGGAVVLPLALMATHRPFRVFVTPANALRVLMLDGDPGRAHRPALVHLAANGALDATRGGGTGVDQPLATVLGSVVDAAMLPDGRTWFVGHFIDPVSGVAQRASPLIASYGVDGITPDFFGAGPGLAARPLTNAVGAFDPAALRVAANGDVYLAGQFQPSGVGVAADFAIAKIQTTQPPPPPPASTDSGGGGGGCGTIRGDAPPDPTLPLLVMLGALALVARGRRGGTLRRLAC